MIWSIFFIFKQGGKIRIQLSKSFFSKVACPYKYVQQKKTKVSIVQNNKTIVYLISWMIVNNTREVMEVFVTLITYNGPKTINI